MSVFCSASRRRLGLPFAAAIAAAICVSACSFGKMGTLKSTETGYSPRVVKLGQPVPPGGGAFKIGRAYTIKGKTYKPVHQPNYDEVGMASWYGRDFHGRKTANGEVYNMQAFSAAHKTLPLPTYARVTNLENGRSVVVRINDRGPFAHNRIIDLSRKTADTLGFLHKGTAKVRVQYVGRAPLDGQDDWLTTTIRDGGSTRSVAAIDRSLAKRAFASDGQKGANRKHYKMAASAYRKGRPPRLSREARRAARMTPKVDVGMPDSPPAPTPIPTWPAPVVEPVSTAMAVPIQIGAFMDPARATQLAARLQPHGEVAIQPVSDAGGVLYRVLVKERPGGAAMVDLVRMSGEVTSSLESGTPIY